MKRLLNVCAFFISLTFRVCAQESPLVEKFTTTFSAGLVDENLAWSIAGNVNGTNPNIYSELIWKNVRAAGAALQVRYNFWGAFVFDADVRTGIIFAGSASDSDYEGDNRTSRVFFATPETNKGNLFSLDPSIGYRLQVAKKFLLTPSMGYGVSRQNFFLSDNTGLNSTYHTRWRGLFWSFKNDFYLSKKFRSRLTVGYHQVNYHAEGNWNLIESFRHPVSFEHTAKGYGIETELLAAYRISNSFEINLSGHFLRWSTGAGIDDLYLNDGRDVKTRLNDVTRKGFTIAAGLSYSPQL